MKTNILQIFMHLLPFDRHLEKAGSHLEKEKKMANEKFLTRKVQRTISESLTLVSGSA